MILETDRLHLRPFIPTDFNDTFEIYQDSNTCKYLLHEPWNTSNAQEHFEKRLEKQDLTTHDAVHIAVVFHEKVIGDISIWYTGMRETVEIGYVFHAGFRGLGFATEATNAVIKHLFSAYPIHRIQAVLDARNIESARLCERIGMRKEAHFIQDYWNKGEWTDTLVYACL